MRSSLPSLRLVLALAAPLALAACSGPVTTNPDTSAPADAQTPADTAQPMDVPQTPEDAAQPQDAQSTADVMRRARGHTSFVPESQRPTAAARLVVMGDSISAGVGASSRSQTAYGTILANNNETAWPMDMTTDLSSFFNSNVTLVNVAVGGATTSTMRRDQIPSLRTRLPPPVMGHTVVVLTIGGNDLQSAIVSGTDPAGSLLDEAIMNIRQVITYLRDPANFPDGTSIYLAAVYDPSDGEGQVRTIEGAHMQCFFGLSLPEFVAALDVWRDRYRALGMELGFSMVDALGHFHGHAHNSDRAENPYYDAADHSYWFNDCIHPNDRGHHEFRRLFFEAINPAYRVMP